MPQCYTECKLAKYWAPPRDYPSTLLEQLGVLLNGCHLHSVGYHHYDNQPETAKPQTQKKSL